MQEIGAFETYPGVNISSDHDIREAIRQGAVSSWQHPTSTCSMLKRELGGVVDSKLRVYGVRGLRIVDASIFPMAVAGHTSSTVYAVAEKVGAPCYDSAIELGDVLIGYFIGSRPHQSSAEMSFPGIVQQVIATLRMERGHSFQS